VHRTYRWLDASPRLFGFTVWQWGVLIVTIATGYGVTRLLGLPVKVAVSAGVFVIGLPAMLVYLSDGEGPPLGMLLRDALGWCWSRIAGSTVVDASTLLGLVAVAQDGLMVREDCTHLRYLEVLDPPNPLVADEEANEQFAQALAGVLARLQHGQALQFYVDARPLACAELLAEEASKVALAASATEQEGQPDLAVAMRCLGAAAEDSIRTRSAEIAAMSVRYVIVVPWRSARRGSRWLGRELEQTVHESSVHDSLWQTEGVKRDLELAGLAVRPLDGGQVLDLIWQRFDPDAAAEGAPPPSFMACDLLGPPEDPGETGEQTRVRARALADALCAPGAFDFTDREHAEIASGFEQTAYLSGVPERTWCCWLLHLMQAPRPFSLSVHVTATDRLRERQAQRRRWRRLRGANLGVEQRGRPLDPRAEEQEREAEEVARELAVSTGGGVYRMSVYLRLRDSPPEPDPLALARDLQTVAREATIVSDGRLDPGRFAQKALWRSSLPLGLDAAGRTRKYLAQNTADTLPLAATGCSSPEGIVLGYAQPGRTLVRLDPFDPSHENQMMIVNGRSGTGKTMTVILALDHAISRGLRASVIDRGGHFEFFSRLIPGSAHVAIGGKGNRQAICPWDVPDPGRVEQSKVDYLLALHTLLLARHDEEHGLGDLEENLLALAIREVYARCALTGEQPRELLLKEELYRREQAETDAGASDVAAVLRNLALRLNNYVGDGPYAYLTDWPTTIAPDARLVVFDTRAIPDSRAAAALFVICEHTIATIGADRDTRLQSSRPQAAWTGSHALVIDEAWKLTENRATGRWVAELSRRSRHLALWLIGMSQQLSDFDTPYGRALLKNAAMRLFLHQDAAELGYMREALDLTDEQVAAISTLQTSKREAASAFFMNGRRGSATVSIRVSALEYWLATNEPISDEPIRRRALRQAGGDAWRALELLADPDWHSEAEALA
jgi:hypothetical protein